ITIPYIWLLHGGIFLVYPPALFFMWRASGYATLKEVKSWKNVLSEIPKWLKYSQFLLLGYCMIIFVAFPDSRVTTGNEAEISNLSNIASFSAAWIFFYFYSALILDASKKKMANN
ncbi:hypothetical protein ACFL2V_22130, partial [Pseudomonadota bacterium]